MCKGIFEIRYGPISHPSSQNKCGISYISISSKPRRGYIKERIPQLLPFPPHLSTLLHNEPLIFFPCRVANSYSFQSRNTLAQRTIDSFFPVRVTNSNQTYSNLVHHGGTQLKELGSNHNHGLFTPGVYHHMGSKR